jgi:hypothetical protein
MDLALSIRDAMVLLLSILSSLLDSVTINALVLQTEAEEQTQPMSVVCHVARSAALCT